MIMKKIILFVLFCAIFTLNVSAENDTHQEIISSLEDELSDFKNSLPDSVRDFLPNEIFKGDFSDLVNGDINQFSFLDFSINYLLSSLPYILKSFSATLVLVLIISIFNIIKSTFSSEGLKNAFSLFSSTSVSIAVFSSLSSTINLSVDYIEMLCSTMNTFTPIMSALYIMNGAITTAAISNTSMMLFLTIIENFILVGLAPIMKICFCFSLVGGISGSVDLSGISKIIKSFFTGTCIFLISIFSFVMSYQTVLSESADSLSLRTAKFAIGNFIPIIGGFIGDSLKTISSSLMLIKNSCGIVAIIVVVLITLPVLISLWLNKFSFSLVASISKMLGIDNESRIFEESCTLCGFALSIVSLTCVAFIFALTIFVRFSVGV